MMQTRLQDKIEKNIMLRLELQQSLRKPISTATTASLATAAQHEQQQQQQQQRSQSAPDTQQAVDLQQLLQDYATKVNKRCCHIIVLWSVSSMSLHTATCH